MINRFSENLVGGLYLFAWRVVRWLPAKAAYGMFYALGGFLTRREGKSVKRLRSNLERVKPEFTKLEMDALIHKAMKSYMRYWCDTFRFPDWSQEQIMKTVSVNGEDLLMDAVRSGSGVIVALPHTGNWDHAGAYFCGKGVKLATVAERLKPEALFQKFLSYREAMGMEVLALDSRSTAMLARRLKEGGLVALVADRDLSKTGASVDFFGGVARMPVGPVILAINTGAPLLTAHVSYTRTGIHIDFVRVEVEEKGSQQERVRATLQRCANNFARGIAEHPEDWHMLQRVWIDDDFKERSDV